MPSRAVVATMAWLDGEGAAYINEAREEDPCALDLVMAGLRRHAFDDSHTIRTLDAEDDIPLGTDLDPVNGYRNFWAAGLARDPNLKALVRCDLNQRVLDAENVGFSFGKEVEGITVGSGYKYEGVRRAVVYFLQRQLRVVVVAKRDFDSLKRDFGSAIAIVAAERTDDVMVLKSAFALNCPIVSRDGYRCWENDLRLPADLREFMKSTAARVQVRFS